MRSLAVASIALLVGCGTARTPPTDCDLAARSPIPRVRRAVAAEPALGDSAALVVQVVELGAPTRRLGRCICQPSESGRLLDGGQSWPRRRFNADCGGWAVRTARQANDLCASTALYRPSRWISGYRGSSAEVRSMCPRRCLLIPCPRWLTIVAVAGRASVAAAGPPLHDMESTRRPRRRI
jgi:hypothetical protein